MGGSSRARRIVTVFLKTVVFVTGSIKAGETAIAKPLAEALSPGYTSFGEEVRERARAKNLDWTNRDVLQSLGQHLISNKLKDFVMTVVDKAIREKPGASTIVLEPPPASVIACHRTVYVLIHRSVSNRHVLRTLTEQSEPIGSRYVTATPESSEPLGLIAMPTFEGELEE